MKFLPLLSSKLCLAASLVGTPVILQQTAPEKALIGQWMARIPGIKSEVFEPNGEITHHQDQDAVYSLFFQCDGKAVLKSNASQLLRFDYHLIKPHRVALYDLSKRKRSPTYFLIVEKNILYFYCPYKLAMQESIDLIYEAKFIKQ